MSLRLFRTAVRMQKNYIEPMSKLNSDEVFWELEANKRISISEFKNKLYVHIRQYDVPEGKDYLVPTKKGIALNLEQFEKLKEVLNSVDVVVQQKVANMEQKPEEHH